MNKYVKADMQTDDQYDYKNLGKLDMRNFTVEATRSIRGIKNVGMLIMPSDNPTLAGAIAAVPKKNIGAQIAIPSTENVREYSGKLHLTPDILPDDGGHLFTEGIIYFTNPDNAPMPKYDLTAIGQIFIGANVNLNILNLIGIQKKGNFLYSVELKGNVFDAMTLANLKPSTLVHLGQKRKVKIAKNITVEELKNKNISIYYDSEVTKLSGNKNVISYINSTL
ncbi:MAG: hypothetical protein OSJ67_04455 [Clostridia bacterium]|nr:hypothetical protein [Clostridia bacterium]